MCLAQPSVSAQAPTPVPAPPPPAPARDPNPAVIDANNDRSNASAKRKGTSIFRNDLSIPTGGGAGPVGTGLSIPR